MKKEYLKPSMKAVEIHRRQQLLADSLTSVSGNVFTGNITGSNEQGHAPEFTETEDVLF